MHPLSRDLCPVTHVHTRYFGDGIDGFAGTLTVGGIRSASGGLTRGVEADFLSHCPAKPAAFRAAKRLPNQAKAAYGSEQSLRRDSVRIGHSFDEGILKHAHPPIAIGHHVNLASVREPQHHAMLEWLPYSGDGTRRVFGAQLPPSVTKPLLRT